MHFLIFALALSMQQAPQTPSVAASAAPETPAAAQAPAPAEDPGDRMVCRREHVLGSNRRERICMTQRQRAELQDRSEQELRRAGRGSDTHALPGDRSSGL